MPRRVYYIDWLRVLAVLLLLPFHTSRVFNVQPFYVKAAELSIPLSYALGFISRWHMQLLFLLAGASSFFALGKRTGAQYVRERFERLLVPFLFGFLVLIPPQTWVGGRFNEGYARSFLTYLTSGDFLKWNIQEGGDYYGGFGIGHLWFIVFLWLISLVVLPLMLRLRGAKRLVRTQLWARRLGQPVWWMLPTVLIYVGESLPDLAGINPFYYSVFFLLGFVIASDASFAMSAERYRWLALGVGVVLSGGYDALWRWRDALPDPSLPLLFANLVGALGTWLVIVGLLGCGKRYLDRGSPALVYLAGASYPFYIIHQTVIVLAAYFVVKLAIPEVLQWVLLLLAAVAGTCATYEIVRRIPIIRMGFGIRGRTSTQRT